MNLFRNVCIIFRFDLGFIYPGSDWKALYHGCLQPPVPLLCRTLPHLRQEPRPQHVVHDGENCFHIIPVCGHSSGNQFLLY